MEKRSFDTLVNEPCDNAKLWFDKMEQADLRIARAQRELRKAKLAYRTWLFVLWLQVALGLPTAVWLVYTIFLRG